MFALQIGMSRWFRRLRKSRNDETADQPVSSNVIEPSITAPQRPLFSLGETKQDVVVSYRLAQAGD